jgi:DNA-binding MarR family transcriptional regulator
MTAEPAKVVSTGAQVQASLSVVLRWASRGEVRRELWACEGLELSPTEVWLLDAIEQRGPVRASDLAAWQGVDKSTVTPQIRRLEEADLVTRHADPEDGRAALLTLTAKGRRARRKVGVAGARLLDQKLAGWSERDRRALSTLLARFAGQLAEESRQSNGRSRG